MNKAKQTRCVSKLKNIDQIVLYIIVKGLKLSMFLTLLQKQLAGAGKYVCGNGGKT